VFIICGRSFWIMPGSSRRGSRRYCMSACRGRRTVVYNNALDSTQKESGTEYENCFWM